MAQAGGTQPENIDKALAKVKDLLKGEKKVAKKAKK